MIDCCISCIWILWKTLSLRVRNPLAQNKARKPQLKDGIFCFSVLVYGRCSSHFPARKHEFGALNFGFSVRIFTGFVRDHRYACAYRYMNDRLVFGEIRNWWTLATKFLKPIAWPSIISCLLFGQSLGKMLSGSAVAGDHFIQRLCGGTHLGFGDSAHKKSIGAHVVLQSCLFITGIASFRNLSEHCQVIHIANHPIEYYVCVLPSHYVRNNYWNSRFSADCTRCNNQLKVHTRSLYQFFRL
jgi:hypothetical protein